MALLYYNVFFKLERFETYPKQEHINISEIIHNTLTDIPVDTSISTYPSTYNCAYNVITRHPSRHELKSQPCKIKSN